MSNHAIMSAEQMEDKLVEARIRLRHARVITVLTGAGISADSGVPTFRGPDGLWRNFRAEDLATPEAFHRDPRLVWEWYNWRRGIIASKTPNPAHYALAQLERERERFWLITQNVDGLHRASGSRHLSEIHGNIWTVRCTKCHALEENHEVPLPLLPSCRQCGGLLRPHIVWFGETLAETDMQQCHAALERCDLFLIIGTSGVVYPAASFAPIAKSSGAFVIELNLDATPHTSIADLALQGCAKDLVPAIVTPSEPEKG